MWSVGSNIGSGGRSGGAAGQKGEVRCTQQGGKVVIRGAAGHKGSQVNAARGQVVIRGSAGQNRGSDGCSMGRVRGGKVGTAEGAGGQLVRKEIR